MKPIIQALLRIRTQNPITLKLQYPLYPRQKLIIKPQVRHQPMNILLPLDTPRLRQDHEVQLPRQLPVQDRRRAADAQDAKGGADEEEAPVGGHDGHHVEEVGGQVREGAGLDY